MSGSDDASYWREASEDAAVASTHTARGRGPEIESIRIHLSQLRATKIQMETEGDARISGIETEIDRVEQRLFAAEEAEWAYIRGGAA